MQNDMAVIQAQEVVTLQTAGIDSIAKAKELARGIVDAPTLDAAARFMLEAKARIKRIKERFAGTSDDPGPKALAKLAWQKIVDMESSLIEPYERIENDILKPAIAQFNAEQERKRRQEEDRQRADARRKAEDEKIRQAAELEKNGDKEAAAEIIDAPVVVAPVVIPKADAPAGISYRDLWRFEITNPDLVPREYLTVDEKKIGGVVRALKGETRIAGVRVYSEKTVAGRV